MTSLVLEDVPVAELRTYHRNPRRGDVARIAESLRVNSQYRALCANRGTHTGRPNEVLAGNHTLIAARDLGWETVAVTWVDVDDDQAARIVAADNRTADLGAYDDAALVELLRGLDDLEGSGYDDADLDALVSALEPDGDWGTGGLPADEAPSLADRFLVPPFDVLDARSGWWRSRKRSWLSLGIRSELGRGDSLTYHDEANPLLPRDVRAGRGLTLSSASGSDPDYYRKKQLAERRVGRELTIAEFEARHYVPPEGPGNLSTKGTSVFDPVLCELAYRWFCPDGGEVLDPFAGGSVRGLVAGMLGRRYRGNDLSEAQVAANREQGDAFAARGLVNRDAVAWSVGDSADWVDTLAPESADLIFTCPPYLWLEQYDRDNPADLSNLTLDRFVDVYGRIIAGAAHALRPDRFAVFVVGNARDHTQGRLVDLRAITERAAQAAGLVLHNTAVLVTPAGSLAVRAPRAFMSSRILARAHQDVVVFYKGDRMRAADACGDVSTALPDDVAAAFDPDAPADEYEAPYDDTDADERADDA